MKNICRELKFRSIRIYNKKPYFFQPVSSLPYYKPSFHMQITGTKILCDDFPSSSILQAVARERLTSILVFNNVFFEGDYLSAVERILKEKINL
jgi:hypothetical protein